MCLCRCNWCIYLWCCWCWWWNCGFWGGGCSRWRRRICWGGGWCCSRGGGGGWVGLVLGRCLFGRWFGGCWRCCWCGWLFFGGLGFRLGWWCWWVLFLLLGCVSFWFLVGWGGKGRVLCWWCWCCFVVVLVGGLLEGGD